MIEILPASLGDAVAITSIYNEGIAERSATFETTPRRVEDVRLRITESRYPMLVASDAERVVGWAGLATYRPRECYAGIAEFSFYVEAASRGHGLGKRLLLALIESAEVCRYWKLVSRIFTFNDASRAACRAVGFREVGIYKKHGQLDGQWLDVVIVERLILKNLLTAPVAPNVASLP